MNEISRERVEKVWMGKWIEGEKNSLPTAECSLCKEIFPEYYSVYKFCPNCGAPMTDEAMDIVLRRLEALHGQKNP